MGRMARFAWIDRYTSVPKAQGIRIDPSIEERAKESHRMDILQAKVDRDGQKKRDRRLKSVAACPARAGL